MCKISICRWNKNRLKWNDKTGGIWINTFCALNIAFKHFCNWCFRIKYGLFCTFLNSNTRKKVEFGGKGLMWAGTFGSVVQIWYVELQWKQIVWSRKMQSRPNVRLYTALYCICLTRFRKLLVSCFWAFEPKIVFCKEERQSMCLCLQALLFCPGLLPSNTSWCRKSRLLVLR